jgi:hypothetical protein
LHKDASVNVSLLLDCTATTRWQYRYVDADGIFFCKWAPSFEELLTYFKKADRGGSLTQTHPPRDCIPVLLGTCFTQSCRSSVAPRQYVIVCYEDMGSRGPRHGDWQRSLKSIRTSLNVGNPAGLRSVAIALPHPHGDFFVGGHDSSHSLLASCATL